VLSWTDIFVTSLARDISVAVFLKAVLACGYRATSWNLNDDFRRARSADGRMDCAPCDWLKRSRPHRPARHTLQRRGIYEFGRYEELAGGLEKPRNRGFNYAGHHVQ